MNNIFHPERFVNLLKRDFMLYRKNYLYLFSLITGSYAIALGLFYLLGISFSGLIYFVIMICVLFGPCVLEKNFSRYNAIQDFTFPVSGVGTVPLFSAEICYYTAGGFYRAILPVEPYCRTGSCRGIPILFGKSQL